MKYRIQKRTGWLVLGAALAGGALLGGRALAAQTQSAGTSVSDPWPNSPVLTRLFRMSGPRTAQHLEVQGLQNTLHLTEQQMNELKRLSILERQSARLGEDVTDRLQARLVNTQINAIRAQKDEQVRKLLGDKYPAFRQWLRGWWGREVVRSRESVQARQLVLPTRTVPPGSEDN